MRPNYHHMAAAPRMTTLPAHSMESVAVHFPQLVMAGGRLLPSGNYTISALADVGEVPILRFQSENGESIAVMVTRDYLPLHEVIQRSDVKVVVENDSTLRVVKVAMAGLPFVYILVDFFD